MSDLPDTLSRLRAGELAGATRLDLSCGLTSFPEEIFDLEDTLEILNLTGNRLSDLPADLPRLAKLKILFCSSNEFDHLPAVLGSCPSLEMVGFKSNRIARIEEDSLPQSLRWLILTDNRIEQLPGSIGRCTGLRKLMLAGNCLAELPEGMASCTSLELIRLSANRFRSLPSWLFQLPRLSWLAISGNPLATAPASSGPAFLSWSDIELQDKLGEGASGVIYQALRRSGGEALPAAVKVFKGEVTSDGFPADEMAASLAAGNHPHLIPVLGKITDHPEGLHALAMKRIGPEYRSLAGPPDFETCTRDVYAPGRFFAASSIRGIAASIAAAAAALHRSGLMHGDLYAHNILWNGNSDVLLGDFGAASFHPSGLAEHLERLEVRAFGCLLEELLVRADRASDADLGDLQELAERCVSPNPSARPLFREIVTSF